MTYEQALSGRGGALRGLDTKRWLYTEPYFRVMMTWPRNTEIYALRGMPMRGERDIEKMARAARDSSESQIVVAVSIARTQYETCPRTLDYWLQDLNRLTEKIARESAGGSSAVTFHVESLEGNEEHGYFYVGIMTGKGRPAPTFPEQRELQLPAKKATAPAPPTHVEPLPRLHLDTDGRVKRTRQPKPVPKKKAAKGKAKKPPARR